MCVCVCEKERGVEGREKLHFLLLHTNSINMVRMGISKKISEVDSRQFLTSAETVIYGNT